MHELDWLSVGGGPQGVHAAARLIGEAGVPARRLRILDPGPGLLSRWRHCTANTGMRYLRSPSVHHLDIEPASLQRYAEGAARAAAPSRGTDFTAPYNRPSLALFDGHCDRVIDRFDLEPLHHRTAARRVELQAGAVVVEDDQGHAHRATRIVLALGAADQPAIPAWAATDPHPRLRHIFDPEVRVDAIAEGLPQGARVVVIGGGISAVQLALRHSGPDREVHVVARHEPREHQFDSDPGWLGPRYMNAYLREPDPARRRLLIQAARHRGSMPPELRRALSRAIRSGRIRWQISDVRYVDHGPVRSIVHLEAAASTRRDAPPPWLDVDQIWLATGFHPGRPGGELVDRLVAEFDLPCAPCGYPIVDPLLRWHPRVVVTGPLAELELGPAARNISGARRAGDRIAALAGRSPLDLLVPNTIGSPRVAAG